MPALTSDDVVNTLNHCLTKLVNSTAAYVTDSTPYTTDADKDALAAMQEIATAERGHAEGISRLIEEMDGIPQTGLPDPLLAEMNYLSFPYLLDVVMKDKLREIALYEKRVAASEGHPAAKALLSAILEEHRAHLAKLKDIRERRYKSESA